MVWFSEIIGLIREVTKGLADIRDALRTKPPRLGFSIIRTNGKVQSGDYLHIKNVSGHALYQVKISIKKENHPVVAIQQVYTLGEDILGNRVRFDIDIPESGVYFLENADFIIPLGEIGAFTAADKLELHFEYMNDDGTIQKGDIVYPVRVDIIDVLQH